MASEAGKNSNWPWPGTQSAFSRVRREAVAMAVTAMALLALLAPAQMLGDQEAEGKAAQQKERKTHVVVSGFYNVQKSSFSDLHTFPLNLEEASFAGTWQTTAGLAFSLGATRKLFRSLALGAFLDLRSSTPTERFSMNLPHPFHYRQQRTLEGEADQLSYTEKAIHIVAAYTTTKGKFVIVVYGGPSYFFTATEIVEQVNFTESYPFDQVSLQSIDRRTYNASGPGLHVGGWFGYRVKDYLAVGVDLRFSWGSMRFATTAGNEIEFSSGGARLGAGARFFF
jgi:hypothetical protein